jgi:hypothetical protein
MLMMNGYIIKMGKKLKTFEEFKKFTKNDLKLSAYCLDTKEKINDLVHSMMHLKFKGNLNKSPNERIKMRKLMGSCDFEWEVITPYTKKN